MIIGLTGTSCSGKNMVAEIMERKGFFVVDEDKLGHVALDMNFSRLVETFGDGIVTDGRIDRKKLGPVVFSSPEGLRKLEGISHPWMVKETERLCREAEKAGKIAVINAAILEKMNLQSICDEVLLIDAPFETRWARARERDGITLEKFRARCSTQVDLGKKSTQEGKKVIKMVNDGDRIQLCRQVEVYCDNISLLRGSAWESVSDT